MIIKELHINSFGCLCDKTVRLEKGFNLIYGDNESGKSTLFAFVIFMFYGTKIKKIPGELSFKEKYTPWNGNVMSGSVIFEYNRELYSLERTYSPSANTVLLHLVSTGEDIKNRSVLDCPGEYFFGINAASFYNSAYISGGDYAFRYMPKDELGALLANSVDAEFTETTYGKMLDELREKIAVLSSDKRKNAVIPLLQKEICSIAERLDAKKQNLDEIAHLETKISELKAQMQDTQKSIDELRADCDSSHVTQDAQAHTKLSVFPMLLFGLLALIFIFAGLQKASVIFAVLLLVYAVFYYLFIRRNLSEKDKLATKLFTIQQNNDKILLLSTKIGEYNECIIRCEERISFLRTQACDIPELEFELSSKKAALHDAQTDLEAYSLAVSCLEEAYRQYKSAFSPLLSDKTAEIFSCLTTDRYNRVSVDDEFNMHVQGDYGYRKDAFMSQGTRQQAMLAMRLALSQMVLKDETVPFFLDDALSFYDNKRLENTLGFLKNYSEKNQVLFSTCRKAELEILKNSDINFIYF